MYISQNTFADDSIWNGPLTGVHAPCVCFLRATAIQPMNLAISLHKLAPSHARHLPRFGPARKTKALQVVDIIERRERDIAQPLRLQRPALTAGAGNLCANAIYMVDRHHLSRLTTPPSPCTRQSPRAGRAGCHRVLPSNRVGCTSRAAANRSRL